MIRILEKFITSIVKIIPTGIPLIILRGPLKGYRLIAGAAAGPAKGVSYILNLSEPRWLGTGKQIISKKDICFDIGANIGMFSLLFSRYSQEVYSFEPMPRNVDFFKKMMVINKITNIKFFSLAISDKNGIQKFKSGDSIATGGLSINGNLEVLTTTLDTFIKEKKVKPSIIKIDVEGGELLILKGAKNYLRKRKPRILLETHGIKKSNEVIQLLKELGYTRFFLINSSEKGKYKEFLIMT